MRVSSKYFNIALILLSAMISSAFLDDCMINTNFSVSYISPDDGWADVPINAVIKVVFKSKAEIDEDFLVSEKFTLGMKKKDDKTKTEDSKSANNKSTGESSDTTEKQIETTPVALIIKCNKPEPIIEENGKGEPESFKRTTCYFIPKPDKKSKRPLEPGEDYIFEIGQLEDNDGNIFPGKTATFSTSSKDKFRFKRTPGVAKIITPDYSSIISPKQEFIVEFDNEINPLWVMENSELFSDAERPLSSLKEEAKTTDAGDKNNSYSMELNEKNVDSMAKRFDYLVNKRIPELEKQAEALQIKSEKILTDDKLSDEEKAGKIESNEAEITKIEKQYQDAWAAAEKINNMSGGQLDKKEESKELSLGNFVTTDKKPIDFSLSFLEDLTAEKDNKHKDREIVTAKFNKIVIKADFDQRYYYTLILKGSGEKGADAIKKFSEISVDPDKEYTRPVTEKGIEINFSGQTEEE